MPRSFLFYHDNKIVLWSYVPKKNRNVILSSCHCEAQISQHERKPTQILDYSTHKGGVDVMHRAIQKFSASKDCSLASSNRI